MDCGVERCLSYFFEPLIIISPFCKNPITAKLKGLLAPCILYGCISSSMVFLFLGVTNAPGELSVDAIKATWLSVYNKFVLNDEKLELKVCFPLKMLNQRGEMSEMGIHPHIKPLLTMKYFC